MPSSDPERRLRDILYSIERIELAVARAGGVMSAVSRSDVFRDAIERRLLIVSEAAVKLGPAVEDEASEIDWRGVRGIGNVLRHSYDQVDEAVISLVITRELPRLKAACQRLLSKLA